MTKIELLNDFRRIIKSQEEIGTRRMYETQKPIELSIARRAAYDMALALGQENGYSKDAVAKIWDMAVDVIDADDGINPDDDPRLLASNAYGSMTLTAMCETSRMTKKDFADQLGISEKLLIALEDEERNRPDLVRDLVNYIIMKNT